MRGDTLAKCKSLPRRGWCDLSSDCHSEGAADADGHGSHEQRSAEQRRRRSQWWQKRQSATARMSKVREHQARDSELPSRQQDVPQVR